MENLVCAMANGKPLMMKKNLICLMNTSVIGRNANLTDAN